MMTLNQETLCFFDGQALLPPIARTETDSVTISDDDLDSILDLHGLRVLIVDDEEDARGLLSLLFEQHGATVTTAASAGEALSILAAANEQSKAELLISDIGMPEQDGYALIREIRSREARRGGYLPAIAVTAWTQVDDRLRALSAGFQTHVPKPVEFAELLLVAGSLTGRIH